MKTSPCLLEGDSNFLLQILNRLAENAVKFTEKGGVAIKVSRASEKGKFIIYKFFRNRHRRRDSTGKAGGFI